MTMPLITVLAHGFTSGESATMLAVALVGLLWFGSVLAGVVLLFVSGFKPYGWMLDGRRHLAVVTLLTTAATILFFIIVGDWDSEPIFFCWVGVVMTCILGIPVLGHKPPLRPESRADASEQQSEIHPS